jgi:hypothetical protein
VIRDWEGDFVGAGRWDSPLRLRSVENPHFSRQERARNGAPGRGGCRYVSLFFEHYSSNIILRTLFFEHGNLSLILCAATLAAGGADYRQYR